MPMHMAPRTSASIDAILDREGGPSLAALLSDDDLLHECAPPSNARLLAFLSERSTMIQLVEYIIQPPPPDADADRAYKHPYVASEVLSTDAPPLSQAFFAPHAEVVARLLSVLEQPAPLPPVLAGYVCKVLVAQHKASPLLFGAFFESAGGAAEAQQLSPAALVERLVGRLESDSILQLLLTLCVGEPPAAAADGGGAAEEAAPPLRPWLPADLLAPRLLRALDDEEEERAANAARLLCALLAPPSAVPPCFGRAACEALLHSCRGGRLGRPPHLAALEVLLRLLARARAEPACCDLGALLEYAAYDVERLVYALAMPAPLPRRVARFLPPGGERSFPRPAARQRCLLLSVIEEMLRFEAEHGADDTPFSQGLIEMRFFPLLLDILLLPHSSNAVHMHATQIIKWTLATDARQGAALRRALVHEAELPSRLLALLDNPSAPAPCCQGYAMGIAAALVDLAPASQELTEYLALCQGWESFVAPAGALARWSEAQRTMLGGSLPVRDSERSEEPVADMSAIERALQLEAERLVESAECPEHFVEYLSQHNFIDEGAEDIDRLADEQQEVSASDDAWGHTFEKPPPPPLPPPPPAAAEADEAHPVGKPTRSVSVDDHELTI